MTLNLVIRRCICTMYCTVYSVHDDIWTRFVMVSEAEHDLNIIRMGVLQKQTSFMQHLPLQPRSDRAGYTCCAPKGYKLARQIGTPMASRCLTSDKSKLSVSMHSDCLQSMQI